MSKKIKPTEHKLDMLYQEQFKLADDVKNCLKR